MGQLVFSRRLGERFWVGDSTCVTVVDVDRGKVRIAVSAPKEVVVMREELLPETDERRKVVGK